MKRYSMWCAASHGHMPLEKEDGAFVLYDDIKHLLAVAEVDAPSAKSLEVAKKYIEAFGEDGIIAEPCRELLRLHGPSQP